MKLSFGHLESLKLFTPLFDGTYSFLAPFLLLWPFPPRSLSWAPPLLGLSLKHWCGPASVLNCLLFLFHSSDPPQHPTNVLRGLPWGMRSFRPSCFRITVILNSYSHECIPHNNGEEKKLRTNCSTSYSWKISSFTYNSSKILLAGWYLLNPYF